MTFILTGLLLVAFILSYVACLVGGTALAYRIDERYFNNFGAYFFMAIAFQGAAITFVSYGWHLAGAF